MSELLQTNEMDTMKSKCSICKQDGHNKRSCKMPKCDVNTEKVDVYSLLLQ